MKLSVIIPVYKVEDTLERCLQSIVSQDYADLEIIVVDDGSPDRCPQICDEWSMKDGRIRVVHKENGGLSSARNAGIDIATGDYITFVDSDDYLAEGTYSSVIREMKAEFDILEYSAELHIGGKKHAYLDLPDMVYHNAEAYWLEGEAYRHTYAWNKIFRAELFREVRFPKGILFEDVHTLPFLLAQSHCIATTSKGRYCYTANPNGITALADGKALAMLLDAHTKVPISNQAYYMHVLNIQIDVYRMTGAPIKLNHLRISKIKNLSLSSKLKAITLNVVGLKNLCRIHKAAWKILH